MYPFIRMAYQFWRHRKDPPLGLTDTHVSRHLCWPVDIDVFLELNNGRTLTLFDLGRIPLARRIGMDKVLRDKGWGLAVAGASVRYRRRITTFQTITMKSRGVTWDDRFFYVEQSMWTAKGECSNHALIRSAVTSRGGIVPPAQLVAALGWTGPPPPVPGWIAAWIAADAERPWPPMTADVIPG
jgi:acyl-CoA thioesterase FadM